MEAAGELGTEEPEPAKKGFFARLFGDDGDDEDGQENEYSAADGGQDKSGQRVAKGAGEGKGKDAKQQEGREAKQEQKPDPLQKKRDKEISNSLEESIIYWQGSDQISPRLSDTKRTLTEVMGLGSSFDVVFREMSFAGRKAALLCISGFAKDTILDEILKRLTYLTPDNVDSDVFTSFMREYIPHIQVEKGDLLSESINKVLTGMSALFIEGQSQVIIMDTRAYPARGPDEPSIERVVRGARDGFTETLLSNIALVRRRVRDPGLKFEMHQVGRRTRTDVSVAYIDDIVDKAQVKAVTEKIKNVNIDGIPLADKQLEEAIVGSGWSPYPLVRYSERPDIVASHLLEGRLVIFVDTSPSVMVLPTTFFDLCQHAEENRQTPFMGTYLRWVRFIGIFASMFLLPLWMLMVIHPELKPPMLEFIGPQKMAKIPILAQFLIVELGVDLLRMAAVHTPTPLGSAMGLIAAILIGDIAVQTGLFVNEVVLYMAVASIGMFATPSYELGLANRIVRLVLLVAVAAFQVQGFMIGTTLLIVLLATHRSYNSPYLWPFIPFNAKALGSILLRQPVLSERTRPSFNKTRDNTRMPPVRKNKKQP
ncbi:spore germination protein ['Paenibacillus yunnanensis' Narsing Rao et al. 2020]|uniref:spore germination protein n=1 Tax=Paenibacillus tengchongensis TaxID=2608684 RepID=UPI00124D4895